jgi:glycosyltransferase involved in cell wall biosynthesis
MAELPAPPLVSFIIPCYNHGRYIKDAVDSIQAQNYPATEIIVVDDGSTDNSQEIISSLPGIKHTSQTNQGLSAARNTGIKNSTGQFLVFLDADDWLLPGAVKTNVAYLQDNPGLAFVSGAHEKVYVEEGTTEQVYQEVKADHYRQMLQGNYIGMHATVMYQRWIFDEFRYDVNLKACEDYDLYLNITRKYPVLHHATSIAAYRIHTTNMSGNKPMMLATTLLVLDRQVKNLRTNEEKAAHLHGHKVWKDYYGYEIYKDLLSGTVKNPKEAFSALLKYQPKLAIKLLLKNKPVVKSFIKNNLPGFSKRWLNKLGVVKYFHPAVGEVDGGDFDRLLPFSREFGYDRGGPVDRYYIENFLKKESASIKGRGLEIGDNEYSLMYGGGKLTQSDILHIDASNKKATFIGDLSDAPQLPDNAFDCIVLTQTLHLIYNFKGALDTCHRILKPGGVLLLTSPGITPIDHGEWKNTWYWSFTDKALQRLVSEAFPGGNVEVETFGNVYVATAFLYGMGITEVPREKLDHQDPQFQVIITVKAVKGASI